MYKPCCPHDIPTTTPFHSFHSLSLYVHIFSLPSFFSISMFSHSNTFAICSVQFIFWHHHFPFVFSVKHCFSFLSGKKKLGVGKVFRKPTTFYFSLYILLLCTITPFLFLEPSLLNFTLSATFHSVSYHIFLQYCNLAIIFIHSIIWNFKVQWFVPQEFDSFADMVYLGKLVWLKKKN